MRSIGMLVVAVVLSTASVASAQRARASATQSVKSARVKAPATKATKPVPRAFKPREKPEKVAAGIPTAALLTQYQRVGRELILLSKDRGAQIGVETEDAKAACAEMQATFRAIKISEAVATPASRAETADLLTELHGKIERLRGIALTADCLNNPLAKDCS
jgi:hypothetical protein